jgi:hypothetical protein
MDRRQKVFELLQASNDENLLLFGGEKVAAG